MTIKWPALKAVLEQHTVDTGRGRLAGFLVRCTSSRKELGYVWQSGTAWRWKTPDGNHFGERSSQRSAVQVLREAFDLKTGAPIAPPLPFDSPTVQEIKDAWRAPIILPSKVKPAIDRAAIDRKLEAIKRRVPPVAEPAPPPPVKKIVWTEQAPDLTAALDAAFRRRDK